MDRNNCTFPCWSSCLILSVTTLLLFGVAWWAVTLIFGDSPSIHHAIQRAGIVVWGSSILGLLPVMAGCRLGVMGTAYGYFIGAGIRVLICILATVIALRSDWLIRPWLTTLMGLYLPLLMLEAGLVGRYLWKLNDSRKNPSTNSNMPNDYTTTVDASHNPPGEVLT